jgi:hypothetical protein
MKEMAAILNATSLILWIITGDAIQEFGPYDKDPDASILTLKSGRKLLPAHLLTLILGLGAQARYCGVVKEAGIALHRGHIIVDDHLPYLGTECVGC